MIFGGLATIAGLISLPLGTILGWLAWLPLAWTITIVRWTARFSWAQLEISGPPFWLMILTYLTLGAAVWWLQRPPPIVSPIPFRPAGLPKSTSIPLSGLLILAILTWSATQHLPDGRLHVTFFDVGQGDAIFITTPNGRQILIDGGLSLADLGMQLGREMPFWDRSLDIIINTHPDLDHLGGLVELLDRYQVGTILVSDATSTSSTYQEWLTELEEDRHEPIRSWQGMRLQLDAGVEALVLNPGPASAFAPSPNDHSVVFKLTMGQISFSCQVILRMM